MRNCIAKMLRFCVCVWKATIIRTRSTRDRNLQFRGAVSTGFFFEFSPVDIFPFLQVYCVIWKEIASRCGENCPISGRSKKRRILSLLWLSWFFRFRKKVHNESGIHMGVYKPVRGQDVNQLLFLDDEIGPLLSHGDSIFLCRHLLDVRLDASNLAL